jgi:hypothetical protein
MDPSDEDLYGNGHTKAQWHNSDYSMENRGVDIVQMPTPYQPVDTLDLLDLRVADPYRFTSVGYYREGQLAREGQALLEVDPTRGVVDAVSRYVGTRCPRAQAAYCRIEL